MENLMDFCRAWITGYVEENDIVAPEGAVEKAIIDMHDHLSQAVDGFMADTDLSQFIQH